MWYGEYHMVSLNLAKAGFTAFPPLWIQRTWWCHHFRYFTVNFTVSYSAIQYDFIIKSLQRKPKMNEAERTL